MDKDNRFVLKLKGENFGIVENKENSIHLIDGTIATDPRVSFEEKGFYFLIVTLEQLEGHDICEGVEIIWNEKNCALARSLENLGYLKMEKGDKQ